MNKLTKIKQSLEIREEMGRRDEDTICMRYLVSLLEEKDKALTEVDKYLDSAIEEINYSLNDNKSKEVKRVYADNAIRFIGCAHKALNASSNNEGELK